MKELLNKWYKNHALVYKILLFLVTTLFIVYLFPKTGKFRYSFEKGKPWQSENLYAPFNFAIQKTQDEINEEQLEIENNAPVYFEIDREIPKTIKLDYITKFNEVFNDSVTSKKALFKQGTDIVETLYENGILDTDYPYSNDKQVVLVASNNTVEKRIEYRNLVEINQLRNRLESFLKQSTSAENKNKMISLFFDIVKPNVTLNEIEK